MDKKYSRRKLKKLRSLEEKLSYSNPKQTAKLTAKIVKIKTDFFTA
jgi:hypothetical protein